VAGTAAGELPFLIVGDVHGDIERLFEALKPYPADRWHTIFLGDLVDYGMFGVGVLRFARDRANTTVLLGNHEVALLWALRDPARIGWWISIGGHRHDLDELARDPALQDWVRARPALARLDDATLAQHCGHDGYKHFVEKDPGDPISVVNERITDLLRNEGESLVWDVLSARNIFGSQPERLHEWLQATNSRRVVFGHTPHTSSAPESYFGGTAINFDGGFSRSHLKHRRASPIRATVAPLSDLSF
jgi:hypothetical protein